MGMGPPAHTPIFWKESRSVDNPDLNARQLRFALGVLEGKDATTAYVDAGYRARGNAAESSASKLLRNPKVAEFLERGRAKAADRALVTRERVVTGLLTIAEGTGADSARVRAWELLGKDIGMWKDATDDDAGTTAARQWADELKRMRAEDEHE